MKIFIGWVLIVVGLAGCKFGGKMSEVYVANNPDGIQIELTTVDEERHFGEYLGLKGDTLIIYSRRIRMDNEDLVQGIAGIEKRQIQTLNFLGNKRLIIDKSHNRHELDRTPLYSRYPQGIDDALLEKILEAYEQDSLIMIKGDVSK